MILSQIASTLGALMILVAYAGQQNGWMKEKSVIYLVLNFLGGSLLLYAALVTRQIGFILLEGSWVLVTLRSFWMFKSSLSQPKKS